MEYIYVNDLTKLDTIIFNQLEKIPIKTNIIDRILHT